jgi:hypothetical protein
MCVVEVQFYIFASAHRCEYIKISFFLNDQFYIVAPAPAEKN